MGGTLALALALSEGASRTGIWRGAAGEELRMIENWGRFNRALNLTLSQ